MTNVGGHLKRFISKKFTVDNILEVEQLLLFPAQHDFHRMMDAYSTLYGRCSPTRSAVISNSKIIIQTFIKLYERANFIDEVKRHDQIEKLKSAEFSLEKLINAYLSTWKTEEEIFSKVIDSLSVSAIRSNNVWVLNSAIDKFPFSLMYSRIVGRSKMSNVFKITSQLKSLQNSRNIYEVTCWALEIIQPLCPSSLYCLNRKNSDDFDYEIFRILDRWKNCGVVNKLLELLQTIFLSPTSNINSIFSLIKSSPDTIDSNLPWQPHWIIYYLTYSNHRSNLSENFDSLKNLSKLLMDSANNYQEYLTVTCLSDEVKGKCDDKDVWILRCLTCLNFMGKACICGVEEWLSSHLDNVCPHLLIRIMMQLTVINDFSSFCRTGPSDLSGPFQPRIPIFSAPPPPSMIRFVRPMTKQGVPMDVDARVRPPHFSPMVIPADSTRHPRQFSTVLDNWVVATLKMTASDLFNLALEAFIVYFTKFTNYSCTLVQSSFKAWLLDIIKQYDEHFLIYLLNCLFRLIIPEISKEYTVSFLRVFFSINSLIEVIILEYGDDPIVKYWHNGFNSLRNFLLTSISFNLSCYTSALKLLVQASRPANLLKDKPPILENILLSTHYIIQKDPNFFINHILNDNSDFILKLFIYSSLVCYKNTDRISTSISQIISAIISCPENIVKMESFLQNFYQINKVLGDSCHEIDKKIISIFTETFEYTFTLNTTPRNSSQEHEKLIDSLGNIKRFIHYYSNEKNCLQLSIALTTKIPLAIRHVFRLMLNDETRILKEVELCGDLFNLLLQSEEKIDQIQNFTWQFQTADVIAEFLVHFDKRLFECCYNPTFSRVIFSFQNKICTFIKGLLKRSYYSFGQLLSEFLLNHLFGKDRLNLESLFCNNTRHDPDNRLSQLKPTENFLPQEFFDESFKSDREYDKILICQPQPTEDEILSGCLIKRKRLDITQDVDHFANKDSRVFFITIEEYWNNIWSSLLAHNNPERPFHYHLGKLIEEKTLHNGLRLSQTIIPDPEDVQNPMMKVIPPHGISLEWAVKFCSVLINQDKKCIDIKHTCCNLFWQLLAKILNEHEKFLSTLLSDRICERSESQEVISLVKPNQTLDNILRIYQVYKLSYNSIQIETISDALDVCPLGPCKALILTLLIIMETVWTSPIYCPKATLDTERIIKSSIFPIDSQEYSTIIQDKINKNLHGDMYKTYDSDNYIFEWTRYLLCYVLSVSKKKSLLNNLLKHNDRVFDNQSIGKNEDVSLEICQNLMGCLLKRLSSREIVILLSDIRKKFRTIAFNSYKYLTINSDSHFDGESDFGIITAIIHAHICDDRQTTCHLADIFRYFGNDLTFKEQNDTEEVK